MTEAAETATWRRCRSVDCYKRLETIAEGQYGKVFKAQDKETGEIVALKKIKMEHEREGFPLTSLREVRVMMQHKHPNIVDMREVVAGSGQSVYIAMEYLDHDLRGLLDDMPGQFLQSEVKCLMLQLLSAVAHLHSHWLVHRDLKTSNLLYSNRGRLKVADLGLAREFGSPPRNMTQKVVTLWYRAPELLLGATTYGTPIDMWSCGCIFAELLLREPLFAARSEPEQLRRIFSVLGTPTEEIWPGLSALPLAGKLITGARHPFVSARLLDRFRNSLTRSGFDLLMKLLAYDPERRIIAAEALRHPYFKEEPLPRDPDLMPTYPSSHACERSKRQRTPIGLDADEAAGVQSPVHDDDDIIAIPGVNAPAAKVTKPMPPMPNRQ